MLQRETGSKSYRCYRILQRGCNGKRSWESIIHCSVEGQMQREFRKLQRQSATTDCNGKVLPLEETGRCYRLRLQLEDGSAGRKEETEKTTESWKWESLNWLQNMQKTRATGDCIGGCRCFLWSWGLGAVRCN